MTTHPSVLLGLRGRDLEEGGLREQLDGWVRGCGFRTRFAVDADEAIALLQQGEEERFAVSFLDSELEQARGQAVWRMVRPQAARRVVLMARDRGRDLWYEALRYGVATVLPLPPVEAMVHAALRTVAGPGSAPRAFPPES